MILIHRVNCSHYFLRSSSHRVRHFSIMEYYRSIRPVPPVSQTSLSIPRPKQPSVPQINHKIKRSTRPYVGPQIETRHPVPIDASSVTWIPPKQPNDPRFLRVALLGLPNSGKSSFINTLLNSTISAVSPKVNTTREDIKGILTVDNTQVVVIDSPGIIASHKRRKFCKDLVKTAWRGFEEADICLFIVDAVKRPKSDLFNILRLLSGKTAIQNYMETVNEDDSHLDVLENNRHIQPRSDYYDENIDNPDDIEDYEHSKKDSDAHDEAVKRNIPIALILNKIDLASHKKWVKSRVRELKLHGNFCDIFYISAKHGIGFLPIINFLKRTSKPGPWVYPPDMVTTLSKVKIVEQLVRTYIFCWFNKDVPYKVDQQIIGWTYAENGSLNIEMELYVKAVKVAKMICGVQGRILKQLQKNVSYKLSKMWNELVFLFIHVKVK